MKSSITLQITDRDWYHGETINNGRWERGKMKSIRSRVVSDKGPQRIQTHHLAAVLKRGRVSPLTFHVQHPFLVENLLFAHFLLFTLSDV